MNRTLKNVGIGVIGVFCLALIAYLLVATVGPKNIQFDNNATSMEPTIASGQVVTVAPYRHNTPQSNDIVEIKDPLNKNQHLISRIIGVPGDTVVIQNGTVTIHNKAAPNGYQPDKNLGLEVQTTGNFSVKLGPKQYYVLGDNRANSLDSRVFGPISSKDIVGKVIKY